MVQAMRLDEIKIGTRHRKDLDDITELAKSIDELGLLQPIVVTEKCDLLAGNRRYRACGMLGWEQLDFLCLCGLPERHRTV